MHACTLGILAIFINIFSQAAIIKLLSLKKRMFRDGYLNTANPPKTNAFPVTIRCPELQRTYLRIDGVVLVLETSSKKRF